MPGRIERLVLRARARRGLILFVVNLRIFLAFALLPSGLKKVIDEPFTDPDNVGPFHEFLHAFFATGSFYHFVGATQLLAATLLFSQRFATAGALLMLPILTVIFVFCWATQVYFTATIVTLMLLGNIGLVLWDVQKWRAIFARDDEPTLVDVEPLPPVVDLTLWRRCGFGILALYLAVCAFEGEIYRPMGLELDNPSFYVFPALLLLPIGTWLLDRARYRRAAGG